MGGLKSESENSDVMAKPGWDDFGRQWPLPGIFEKIADDYRPVAFGPTLDEHRAGPSPMVRTGHVRDVGLGRTQSTFRPTSPQPAGRKRRVDDRLALGPGIGMPASTPWKRALLRSDGQDNISSGSDVPEGGYSEVVQSSRSPQNDDHTGTWSPNGKFVDAVLQLQKDMEEFWAECGYGSAGRQATLVQTSGRSGFTSTPVHRYAGRSSWDQYRHVFEAIVHSNGWDHGTTTARDPS